MFTGIFLICHYISDRTIDNHHIVVLHCCKLSFRLHVFLCVSRERPNQPNSLNFFHLCTLLSESMLVFSTAPELNFHFFCSLCMELQMIKFIVGFRQNGNTYRMLRVRAFNPVVCNHRGRCFTVHFRFRLKVWRYYVMCRSVQSR